MPAPNRPWHEHPIGERTPVQSLIDDVDCAGGVFRSEEHGGCMCPEAAPDWPDLGETYVLACQEQGVEPSIQED